MTSHVLIVNRITNVYPRSLQLPYTTTRLAAGYRHFFCLTMAENMTGKSRVANCIWSKKPEYPEALAQVTGNFLTCPGRDLGGGKRKREVDEQYRSLLRLTVRTLQQTWQMAIILFTFLIY